MPRRLFAEMFQVEGNLPEQLGNLTVPGVLQSVIILEYKPHMPAVEIMVVFKQLQLHGELLLGGHGAYHGVLLYPVVEEHFRYLIVGLSLLQNREPKIPVLPAMAHVRIISPSSLPVDFSEHGAAENTTVQQHVSKIPFVQVEHSALGAKEPCKAVIPEFFRNFSS